MDRTPGCRVPVSCMYTHTIPGLALPSLVPRPFKRRRRKSLVTRLDLTQLSTQPDQSITVNYGLFQGNWERIPQEECISTTRILTLIQILQLGPSNYGPHQQFRHNSTITAILTSVELELILLPLVKCCESTAHRCTADLQKRMRTKWNNSKSTYGWMLASHKFST